MWIYQNKKITSLSQLPDNEHLTGYVYLITNLTNGKIYIGKKNFYTERKKALSKKLQSTDKRKKKYIIVKKESDWITYNSSCAKLIEDINKIGVDKFERRILRLCKTAKQLTYYEMVYQVEYKVLHSDSYNDTILGSFFRKDV
jgi:hypothetical protein